MAQSIIMEISKGEFLRVIDYNFAAIDFYSKSVLDEEGLKEVLDDIRTYDEWAQDASDVEVCRKYHIILSSDEDFEYYGLDEFYGVETSSGDFLCVLTFSGGLYFD